MLDPSRIDFVLNDLKLLWEKYPDMRLCQLLHMMAMKSGWENNDLFYIEDGVIFIQIQKELMRLEELIND